MSPQTKKPNGNGPAPALAVARTGLLSAVQVGPYALRNRVALAPLTRNRAGEGNAPRALNVLYYAQRASAGLVITEATQVSPEGVGYPHTPGIHSDAQIRGWREVTGAVHLRGGRIFLQLWHVGRISHPALQPEGALPVAPSAIKPAGEALTYEGPRPFVTPRALGTREIAGIVEQYREAAENAAEAGFDGVEVHAANGYLIDQFLRDGTNRRTDRYGGNVVNRMRLLDEVVDAVAGVWGADRVGVRLSPVSAFNDIRDSDPAATFGWVAERLGALGLGYLHVVEAGGSVIEDRTPAFDFGAFRRLFPGTYVANGGYDRARGEAAVASGHADLVAYGKLFLANPDLPERFARDAALNRPEPATFYGGDGRGYTDYPFLRASPVGAADEREVAAA